MKTQNISILHPGEMGISIAASTKNSGHSVFLVSQGRSEATHARAEQFDLRELRSLSELCETCFMIISVCHPNMQVN